ncbi:MAG: ABC transporter ATP-binding protein [Oscillospiraceae bacterium]|nr:ABC transporter ATP-binding protein [Oscillospiraceae bacterium]
MNKKAKTNKSLIFNILFFVRLLFEVSPLLVIGEFIWGILLTLPTRLISVLGVKYIIDVVTDGKNLERIFYAVAVIAVILILSKLLAWLFREFFWNVEREKVYYGLNKKLYEKAKSLDLESYDNPEFYNNFILTIESSSDNIQNLLGLVRNYMGNIISLLTISTVLLTIDPVCLLIILAIITVFLPLSKKIGNLQMQRRVDNAKYHRRSDYFQRIFYLQDYAKEVRMNGIRPLLMDRYNDAADDVITNQKKYQKKIASCYAVQEIGVQVFGFMFILPLYLGYCVLVKNTLAAGDFVATFNGASSIAMSINFLTIWGLARFSEQAKMIEKYREFLSTGSKINDGKTVSPVTEPKEISIKNLSFTYPGNDKPTLENINLTIKPYEKIALVGYNGAGKTTLTNLLLRLYDVSGGSIQIDGKDIRESTVDSYRGLFAAVFQDFQIFACSAGENVAMDIDPEAERVMESLKHSGFSKKLKNGTDSELLREFDDNGMMLSGGESQKIAIARAFYKNCPYVILDEPSANLDPIAEYNLNQAMIEAAHNKTVIFISHRLSTTVNADKIYVMENGKIIESGSHKELMEQNGTYAYMFNLQAEKYKTANAE